MQTDHAAVMEIPSEMAKCHGVPPGGWSLVDNKRNTYHIPILTYIHT